VCRFCGRRKLPTLSLTHYKTEYKFSPRYQFKIVLCCSRCWAQNFLIKNSLLRFMFSFTVVWGWKLGVWEVMVSLEKGNLWYFKYMRGYLMILEKICNIKTLVCLFSSTFLQKKTSYLDWSVVRPSVRSCDDNFIYFHSVFVRCLR
jgi:hypothetical protein